MIWYKQHISYVRIINKLKHNMKSCIKNELISSFRYIKFINKMHSMVLTYKMKILKYCSVVIDNRPLTPNHFVK